MNPSAEGNILGNPHAVDQVLAAEWPVTTIGLDVAQKVILPEEDLRGIIAKGGQAGLQGLIANPHGFVQPVKDDLAEIARHRRLAVAEASSATAFRYRQNSRERPA